MTNIIGPHGTGINETTTRPTDTASGYQVDTWFQPCINGDPNTGTKIPAVWLNKVTALLRRAIRGMSVPEDELDDDMLLKAIKQAMPLLVNSTSPLATASLDWTVNGALNVSNKPSQTVTANVNVAPLTNSPLLRAGFAMVTVQAMAQLDDASIRTRNAEVICRATNGGRTVVVVQGEMDAYDSGGGKDDIEETGDKVSASATILVPLFNAAGSFTLEIATDITEGEVAAWGASMSAYLDAIFPRIS